MEIFKYRSYKKFILNYVKSLPGGGRGEFTKISEALKIHNTTLSQILKGDKNFTGEQGLMMSEYLGLNKKETHFLILLINAQRATSKKLQAYYTAQAQDAALEAEHEVSFQEPPDGQLTEEVKAQFYSFWGYSGLRVLSSIPKYQTLDALSERSGFSKRRTKEMLDFLVASGLCEKKGARYFPGIVHTHINARDSFINVHRTNWRAKAIERLGNMGEGELCFSAPLSLSKKDFSHLRADINRLIEEVAVRAKSSQPEVAVCLNIDWLKF